MCILSAFMQLFEFLFRLVLNFCLRMFRAGYRLIFIPYYFICELIEEFRPRKRLDASSYPKQQQMERSKLNPVQFFKPAKEGDEQAEGEEEEEKEEGDLSEFWREMDLSESNLTELSRLIDRFGVQAVIHSSDSAGKTLAHWIASRGSPRALALVVERAPEIVATWRDDHHQPLVHIALQAGNFEVLNALVVDYGQDVSIVDNYGSTALMRVIMSTCNLLTTLKSYDLLLHGVMFGMDIHETNRLTGQTALHYAVQRDYLQDVYLLLGLGAKPDVRDRWSRSPADMALLNGNRALAQMLEIGEKRPTSGCCFDRFRLFWRSCRNSPISRGQQTLYWMGVFFSVWHIGVFVCYMLPVYFIYYIGHTPAALLPLHIVLILCTAIMLVSGLWTAFTGSGRIPRHSELYKQLMHYFIGSKEPPLKRSAVLSHLFAEGSRLCHVCEAVAPRYSKHCYLCRRCCIDYDHHCIFLFTCIGGGNLRHFILFTLMMGVCGLLGLVVILASVMHEQGLKQAVFAATGEPLPRNIWLSLFTLFNLIICLKFGVSGLVLGLRTIIMRRQQLRQRGHEQKQAFAPGSQV